MKNFCTISNRVSNVPTYAIFGEFDPVLNEKVVRIKKKVENLIGEQQYLADPPHCTFYLGLLDGYEKWAGKLSSLTLDLSEELFRINLISWGTFFKDSVTGNNTLFCSVDTETKTRLFLLQALIIETVNPYRTKEFNGRYKPCLEKLNVDQRENLKQYGFPYVGNEWLPHVTIASIDPARYDEVYSKIRDECPTGKGIITTISIYEIQDAETLHHLKYIYRNPDYE